jgi:hypothetical protein
MPAVSQVQQQAAAIEDESREQGNAPRRFKSMKSSDLHKFASTKTKGLPHRAESGRAKRRRRIAELRAKR